jgi:sarcosine oxidase subunit alpha
VTIFLDDEPVVADRGEPLALALLAADKTTLARSPKLHRPRGPSCMRGGCDGCLARVDGEPNVMTCLRATRGGERIETQNVVGSRSADLLRVTDWFFPHGIDHHHLMAGVPGVQNIMQGFARKLAGLGRLPAEITPERAAKRLDVDVLVVGGGYAGVTVAARLARAKRRVCLVDDGLTLGGASSPVPALAAEIAAAPLSAARVMSGASAVGVYRTAAPEPPFGEALLVSPSGAHVVRAHALVFATGAHDPVLSAPNNDLPGVFSARALCRLVARGVVPDAQVALIGDGFWAEELVRVLGKDQVLRVPTAELTAIKGAGRVRAVELTDARGGERKVKVAAVAVAGHGAPAFELLAQAGARVEHIAGVGYAPARDAHGRIADRVWATGECAGLDFDPAGLHADAEHVAASVLASDR